MTMTLDKLHVKSLHDHKHSMSEVWARLNQREKSYAPDKIVIYNTVITLSFNWQTWFKITALPLLNYIAQCVEVWAWLGRGGGGRYSLDKWSWTDDGRSDHYKVPAYRDPNSQEKTNKWLCNNNWIQLIIKSRIFDYLCRKYLTEKRPISPITYVINVIDYMIYQKHNPYSLKAKYLIKNPRILPWNNSIGYTLRLWLGCPYMKMLSIPQES